MFPEGPARKLSFSRKPANDSRHQVAFEQNPAHDIEDFPCSLHCEQLRSRVGKGTSPDKPGPAGWRTAHEHCQSAIGKRSTPPWGSDRLAGKPLHILHTRGNNTFSQRQIKLKLFQQYPAPAHAEPAARCRSPCSITGQTPATSSDITASTEPHA